MSFFHAECMKRRPSGVIRSDSPHIKHFLRMYIKLFEEEFSVVFASGKWRKLGKKWDFLTQPKYPEKNLFYSLLETKQDAKKHPIQWFPWSCHWFLRYLKTGTGRQTLLILTDITGLIWKKTWKGMGPCFPLFQHWGWVDIRPDFKDIVGFF